MTSSESSPAEQLRGKAWEAALHAHGTAAIFGRRARQYQARLNVLAFLGLAPIVAVGGVALAGVSDLKWFVLIVGLLAVPVTVWSLWSLIDGWSGKLAAATQSQTTNLQIQDEYEALGERPPADITELERRFDLIAARDQSQRGRDLDQHVSQAEKRFGMRAALRQRQKECVSCNFIPRDMKPTDCGVCGDFPKRWQR
ncbi:mobilome CxxCx(11)CxxC protein [Nocardia nova]|uniref:mobilome CxxCx(11)CxxC protein n=1 Tax=Nocardia nova TaxID=37330 RepID=UPI001895DB4E|nr:mobilome CxxCx(11)CxxC protein [Nocardia nova]MBF6278053.1 hypothetical protein [Nocardia nova]